MIEKQEYVLFTFFSLGTLKCLGATAPSYVAPEAKKQTKEAYRTMKAAKRAVKRANVAVEAAVETLAGARAALKAAVKTASIARRTLDAANLALRDA